MPKKPSACLVVDRGVLESSFISLEKVVLEAILGGINMVRFRHFEDLNEVKKTLNLVKKYKVTLMVDSENLARDVGADGVHLSYKKLKTKLDSGLIKGVSVHSEEETKLAISKGVDYLFFGSVFESKTHPTDKVGGLDTLSLCVKVAKSVPVLGIGGINHTNAHLVAQNGASGFALIRAIIEADNPKDETVLIKKAFGLVK